MLDDLIDFFSCIHNQEHDNDLDQNRLSYGNDLEPSNEDNHHHKMFDSVPVTYEQDSLEHKGLDHTENTMYHTGNEMQHNQSGNIFFGSKYEPEYYKEKLERDESSVKHEAEMVAAYSDGELPTMLIQYKNALECAERAVEQDKIDLERAEKDAEEEK